MSRDLTAAAEAASLADAVYPLFAAELDFPSGVQRLHTGCGDITIDGETFTGCGNYSSVSNVAEGSTLEANGVVLALSGVGGAQISIALNDHYQGRPAKLWVGFLDSDYALVADPVGPWKMRMDTSEIGLGGEAVVSLSLETRAIQWKRANLSRYTHEDQRVDYPDDDFFIFVPRINDSEIIWPHAPGARVPPPWLPPGLR